MEDVQKQVLEALLGAASRVSGIPAGDLPGVKLETPADPGFGDLASNLALILARRVKRPPRELAELLVSSLELDEDLVEKVEVAGPGFINFVLSRKYLLESLREILAKGDDYGRLSLGNGLRAQVEFVSANPTGPLTVGHGRQAAIGDTVANILSWAGYDVTREYYFNNAGRQMRILGESVRLRLRQELGEELEFPEEYYQGEYIRDIARDILAEEGPGVVERDVEFFKKRAEEAIFADIRRTLDKMGVNFDSYFNEDSLYSGGQIKEVLRALRRAGYVYDADGATWFRAEKFGRPKDRVLVKSTGEPTYILPDMAYHQEKFRRGFDLIVDVFGADHKDTYSDMLAGVKALGWDTGKVRVLIHQFVTLSEEGKQVKMSTRKANFVTLEELIDEVGAAVVRFFFLMRRISSHLDFDMKLARTTSDENPVYYVQYAHARICSILDFAADSGVAVGDWLDAPLELLVHDEESSLVRKLIQFPQLVAEMVETLQPHPLTTYLRDMATAFHNFYHAGKMDYSRRVVTDDEAATRARLALVVAARTVLRNGLNILGIEPLDKM